jgi:hypothetical protein
MSSALSLDDLVRAANAAGYAMAAEDDGSLNDAPVAAVSVEDLGRGARPVVFKAAQVPVVLVGSQTATKPAAPQKGLMASAGAMRETVYGYLGINATA